MARALSFYNHHTLLQPIHFSLDFNGVLNDAHMEINAFFWIATIKRAQIFVGDVDCKLNEHVSSNMLASLWSQTTSNRLMSSAHAHLTIYSKSETEKNASETLLVCSHLLHASKRPSMIKLEWEIMHRS